MTTIRTLLAAIATVPFLMAAGAAQAAKPVPPAQYVPPADYTAFKWLSACAPEYANAAAVIAGAGYVGPTYTDKNAQLNMDGLHGKLYGSDQKLYQGKTLEAEALLVTIADTATTLANAGKMDPTFSRFVIAAVTFGSPLMNCVMAH